MTLFVFCLNFHQNHFSSTSHLEANSSAKISLGVQISAKIFFISSKLGSSKRFIFSSILSSISS